MMPKVHVRRHPRARRIKLRVRPDASIEVMAPPGVGRARILSLLDEHRPWIERARAWTLAVRRPPAERGPFPTRLVLAAEALELPVVWLPANQDRWDWTSQRLEVGLCQRHPTRARSVLIDALKSRARERLEPRLESLAARHALRYRRVGWRNQKTRWGSCSTRRSISLNVRLLFLAPALVDYVMAHELAHLVHPNHSPAFWDAVERLFPDYRNARRALRQASGRVPEWLL
jgi:predicted metal-dependent hydrolase